MDYLDIKNAAAWEDWLEKHHQTAAEVWLRIAKKGSGKTSVTIDEALDINLCYGWIDSHRKSLDDKYFLQRYSPRRTKSPWSDINIAKAKVLIKKGRMKPAGMHEIERAKADGRWRE